MLRPQSGPQYLLGSPLSQVQRVHVGHLVGADRVQHVDVGSLLVWFLKGPHSARRVECGMLVQVDVFHWGDAVLEKIVLTIISNCLDRYIEYFLY